MKTVSALTLGCKVNQYDTNAMLGLFREAGYEIVPWGAACDIALVNTCAVTKTAEHKCRSAIRQAAGRGSAVCVCGCLAQKQKEALLSEAGVCWVVGTAGRSGIVGLVESGHGKVAAGERSAFEELEIADAGSRTRAVVKVQEGCSNYCAYCIIPFLRGKPQSRPSASVLREVDRLTRAGVREIVLTGTNLASYSDEAGGLAELIAAVEERWTVGRLRLGSLEPGFFTAEISRRLADSEILCPHFHLSLQSGSARILAAMNRHYSPGEYLRELDRIRSFFDDPAISTDVMTGFPGEQTEDFEQTAALVRRAAFARLHVFPYSAREGTRAARQSGQVPQAERRRRALELIETGRELEGAYASSQLGRIHSVLFEEEEDGMASGYSERYIHVRARGGQAGTIGRVRTAQTAEAVLLGTVLAD
ncbi:MAG: MiaB/RimO family radical SAM methylthiotransferase [Clostridia bacterium]|nr:MiaB/RimO family radical SAM methylthiotransferase [Clostridia bacterium]